MNPTLKAWNATHVRRWHTHPQMVDSADYNGGHQHRCAILLMHFFPNFSKAELVLVLTHDQGEIDSGDMAGPAKRKNPTIRDMLKLIESESLESQNFPRPETYTSIAAIRCKYVDLLDSYIWVMRYKPQLLQKAPWLATIENLLDGAKCFGFFEEFVSFLEAAEEEYSC